MKSLRAWSTSKLQDEVERVTKKEEDEACLQEIESGLESLISLLIAGLSLYASAQYQARQNENMKRWVAEQGGMLRSTIDVQTEKIRTTLLSSLAQAVGPLLTDAIEMKAMTDFCSALEKVLDKALLSRTTVSVPKRLNSKICEELLRRGLEVKIHQSEQNELSAQVNELRIETHLTSVLNELDGILQQ